MASLTFIQPNGETATIEAELGQSIMSAAFDADIPGIDALCGGGCNCGTCHVRIDNEQYLVQLEAPEADELDILSGLPDTTASSRLSCQVIMVEALDGMVLRLPD